MVKEVNIKFPDKDTPQILGKDRFIEHQENVRNEYYRNIDVQRQNIRNTAKIQERDRRFLGKLRDRQDYERYKREWRKTLRPTMPKRRKHISRIIRRIDNIDWSDNIKDDPGKNEEKRLRNWPNWNAKLEEYTRQNKRYKPKYKGKKKKNKIDKFYNKSYRRNRYNKRKSYNRKKRKRWDNF